MRAVVQRVTQAQVNIGGKCTASIGNGMLVLVGVEDSDTPEDTQWLCAKLVQLRIFDDADGVPNLSVKDVGGEVLVVSQFTLFAATKKGNRPSYIRASKPPIAVPLYEQFLAEMTKNLGKPVAAGVFGADMEVNLVNNGPITIIFDTKHKDF